MNYAKKLLKKHLQELESELVHLVEEHTYLLEKADRTDKQLNDTRDKINQIKKELGEDVEGDEPRLLVIEVDSESIIDEIKTHTKKIIGKYIKVIEESEDGE